jgi:hypothetical protein
MLQVAANRIGTAGGVLLLASAEPKGNSGRKRRLPFGLSPGGTLEQLRPAESVSRPF